MTYAAVPPARRRPSANVGNACAPSQRQQSRARVVRRHAFLLCPAVTLAAKKSVASPALVNTDENKEEDEGRLSFGAAGDGGKRHRVDDEPVDDGDAPVGVQRSLNYQLSLLASGAAEMPGRRRTRIVFKRRGSSWAAGAPELNQSNCISKLIDPTTVGAAQIWASAATRSGGQPSKGRKLEFFRARPAWRCAHKLHWEK
jgi:hypothetical protein